jgi:hypothetical protein
MEVLAFLAVTALGLFVSGLWWLWRSQFDNIYLPWLIWMTVCIGYAAIYDRRQARLRQSTMATKEPTKLPSH